MMRPSSALSVSPLDARHDAVAVHRLGEIRGGDVDVLPLAARVLGDDESETAGIRGEPADDEVHLLGQAEAVAANLQQLAGVTERLQLALEGGALLARHAQDLRELAGGGGMMNRARECS